MSDMEKLDVGGRPVKRATAQQVHSDLMIKSVANVKELVDKGDAKTSLAIVKAMIPLAPPDPVRLKKIRSVEDAQTALAQLIEMVAKGTIPEKQSDRLERLIVKYLDSTLDAKLRDELEQLRENRSPVEIKVIPVNEGEGASVNE